MNKVIDISHYQLRMILFIQAKHLKKSSDCPLTLLNRTEHLIDLKPLDGEVYRVMVAVDATE
ncbi:hypothetical protein [Bacillus pumilus]|uniref:hypothetical protein n=1 Tax=Bacillus pumilus TaxID=1408 RepID=UPI00311E1DFA